MSESADLSLESEEPFGSTDVSVDLGGGPEELATVELPEELPVLPLKNTVLYPSLVSPLLVTTERSRKVIDEVLVTSERLMIAPAVRRGVEGSPGPDDLYRVGTVLRVVKMLKFPDDSYRLLVQGVARARISEFVQTEPFLRARSEILEERGEYESVEVEALQRQILQEFGALVSIQEKLSEELHHVAANLEEPGRLADFVASNLELDLSQKQAILEEVEVGRRLARVLTELNRATEAHRIETEIREKVQSELGKTQREYMLRQQIDAIRKELGEGEDERVDIDALRERLESAQLPEDAHEQATRELERLANTPVASAEHGVIRTYLEWMVDLPWAVESEDRLDIADAKKVLDEDHYDLEKVKDRILEYIAVLRLKRDLKGPILCFAGPPGTGKTSLGRSVARALGREFVRVSLGGVRDEAEIRGHRRTYVGALPGRILQGLRKAKTRNPVFLLDEVDKVGADFRGDPSSALLEVLDPEQNATFSDHYLEVPFDLSKVLFIATANWMEPVPAALRDRMEVIELAGYTREDKLEIAKRYLVPRQQTKTGLAETGFALSDAAIEHLIDGYTREAGVRNLEREIASLCRKTARRVAEEGPEVAGRIEAATVRELLGPEKFEPELAERAGRPGVAVGLAWTPVGGDILFVESTRMPGRGGLKITGSLGDVMRESAEAARSWLRSQSDTLELGPERFDESDLHVHVPAGAVPKDGPSAGVAMVTSLASLLFDRAARADVAMTGEITLRGKVLPVGGIKEKLLAAKRAGIRQVVLPEANRRDVEEVAPALLKGLEIRYVATIEEALERTLEPAA